MNLEDIKTIEENLNISLPESYKQTIQNYPFDESFNVVKDYLGNNSKNIIDLNLHYRKNGYQGKAWPERFYIIGKMSGENIFFINLEDVNSETIYFLSDEDKYNPKNVKKHRYSDSFQEFIQQCKVLQRIHNKP